MFGREPVLWTTAIRSVILLGIAFGLHWTPEQIAAMMIAVEAILALVVRSQVIPIVRINDGDE